MIKVEEEAKHRSSSDDGMAVMNPRKLFQLEAARAARKPIPKPRYRPAIDQTPRG